MYSWKLRGGIASQTQGLIASSPNCSTCTQGRTDHLITRALPEGPGSVGGPMKCPWKPFIGFFGVGKDTGAP
ncbi:unnamed protein product [Staurois parvus]|uniref:Uncharacterized protein n=1 Tax=Staurois parvus TaxID=386267 RepID=A0ABN9EGH7_9NEOB|nr:unnamed protein product [Staurois parvus]